MCYHKCGQKEIPCSLWVGILISIFIKENRLKCLRRLKIELSYDPTIPISTELKSVFKRHLLLVIIVVLLAMGQA